MLVAGWNLDKCKDHGKKQNKTKNSASKVRVCVGGGSFFFKMFSQTTKPALGVLQKRKKLKKKKKEKIQKFQGPLIGK